MRRPRRSLTRPILIVGAVMVTAGVFVGCTHGGGLHGGHPDTWGGGYGGCELDFQTDVHTPQFVDESNQPDQYHSVEVELEHPADGVVCDYDVVDRYLEWEAPTAVHGGRGSD